MKRHTIITIIICACILAASGFLYLRTGTDASGKAQEWASGRVSESPPSDSETSASEKKETGIGECTVYICGAVKHPGVYRLHGDARVCDAVDAAGGLSRKADAFAVNQARLLTDGEQITIPRKGKKSSTKGRTGTDDKVSGLVNINQADLAELMTLAGIGEAKAQLIIDYRTENGSFSSIEDIMKISGIKEGIYNRIKDQITI